jgi:hypothetical protein
MIVVPRRKGEKKFNVLRFSDLREFEKWLKQKR